MKPLVSVIIPSHNAAATIVDQLDAVRESQHHAPPSEILVVDNRSTDDLVEVVTHWAERNNSPIRIISAHERAGEPYARNIGLAHARGDFVVYCDADDRVGPMWLASLCELLEVGCYATGPIDMNSLNPSWIANVRGASVTGPSLMLDTVPYAHGCNMGFRRLALEALGGFDERYTAGCDLDIAIRMWEAGIELQYDERAVVCYRLRRSIRATYRQGKFYGRYRVAILAQLAEVGLKAPDRRLHRLVWLVRTMPAAVFGRAVRARWSWVAGQWVGERVGSVDRSIIDLTDSVDHGIGDRR